MVQEQQQERINGLDMAGFRAAVAEIAQNPDAVHNTRRARVRWMGGFKFSTLVRNHTFIVDEPATLTGEDAGPSPMEYIIGTLGACLAIGFVLNASKQGIAIRNMEVTLEGDQMNHLRFLGLSEEGHPGFERITAKLFVQADADEPVLRAIWEHTVATSPVGNTLTHVVPITPDIAVFP